MSSRPSFDWPHKPTILLIGNFLSERGGSRGICEDLALRLRAANWPVITASARRNRTARLLDMIDTTWRYRSQYRIAQVEVYSGPAFIWAEVTCFLLHYLRKPFVLALHGGNLPVFAQRWPGRVQRLLRAAEEVTTPSRYLQENLHVDRHNIRLLPNPIELFAYKVRVRDQPAPSLVWLRAFHKVYNPSLAAHVVAALHEEFPGIHLMMIGPDKSDGSFGETKEVATNTGVANLITYSGGVPKQEVPVWLQKGDIFLNTTNVDNTPVSVIEAMACGLCVVTTNVGGLPYLVSHERNALLVPPNDPKAMAAAVRRVLTEPGLAHRLSSNARVTAEQFDWAHILPQWEALFLSVAKQIRK